MVAQRHEGANGQSVERGDADLVVRGQGGHVFAMDIPTDPARLEVFHGQLAKGELVIVEGDAPAPADDAPVVPEQPARNAKLSDWQAYALAMGADPGEVELASRDELVDLFVDPEPTPG